MKRQARRILNRLDNEEVRTARRLTRRAAADALDVLHLGESTTEWVAPYDTDRRPLWTMIADELVDPSRYAAAYGGSYSAELHNAYLRRVLAVRRPRLIIQALWYRGRFLPWREHPVFGRAAATSYIDALPVSTPWWRIHASLPDPRPEQWRRYRSLRWSTFAEFDTIGEYVGRLKDPVFARRDPAGRAKLIYAYHQTHRIEPDAPELEAVRVLGATLRSADCPVVVYETPVSVPTGRRHWGDAFGEVAAANFAALGRALEDGFGGELDVLRTGAHCPEQDFIDPDVADEHLNERGRARISAAIVDRVRTLDPSLVRKESA